MRISDWSSDVCSSDLLFGHVGLLIVDFFRADDVDRGRLFEVGVADQRAGDDDFAVAGGALGCVLRIGRSRNQGDAHHERCGAQLQLGIVGFLHSAVPCYWWIEITRTPSATAKAVAQMPR